jgi:hypothetical protein
VGTVLGWGASAGGESAHFWNHEGHKQREDFQRLGLFIFIMLRNAVSAVNLDEFFHRQAHGSEKRTRWMSVR